MELDLKFLKISESDCEATRQQTGRNICQVVAKCIIALRTARRLVIALIYLASDDSVARLMYTVKIVKQSDCHRTRSA
jgi:hypothetical protein